MAFVVKAHVNDVMLTANAETAKEALAKAVEWHVAEGFTDVTISDGNRSFTIEEFSSAMASLDIASILDATVSRGPKVPE